MAALQAKHFLFVNTLGVFQLTEAFSKGSFSNA